MQDHLDLRARSEEDAVRAGEAGLVKGPDGRPRTWREPGNCRWLASLFGVVRVSRVAHRGPGSSNEYPADAALSLPAGRHSLGVRRLAVLEAVRGSFDHAGAAIERRCGKVVGKRRLATLVVEAAMDVAAFYAAKIPVPCTRDMPLVIQADGKGVVMRPDALREATRKAAAKNAAAGRRGRLAPGEKPNRLAPEPQCVASWGVFGDGVRVWAAGLGELHERFLHRFARSKPRESALAYFLPEHHRHTAGGARRGGLNPP